MIKIYIYTEDGAKALDLPQLKLIYKCKYWKCPKAGQTKPKLLSSWNSTKHDPIAKETKWTEDEQSELDRLESEDIKLCHTEVGRQIDMVVHNTITAITKISDKQLKKLKDAIPDQADEHECQEENIYILDATIIISAIIIVRIILVFTLIWT